MVYSLCFVLNVLQEDGGKKIELKPGFLMEHDKDVSLLLFSYLPLLLGFSFGF